MIYNFGSINADYIYQVPHLPVPGETLAATALTRELGGKGANQSVAASRAGAQVIHVGAVGPDGAWAISELEGHGVDCTHVTMLDSTTGHAIINVDTGGENAIVIFPGANQEQSLTDVESAFMVAGQGDFLLLQNETNLQAKAAKLARSKDMTVVYSAAPFSPDSVRAVLPYVDILVMNSVEFSQLTEVLGDTISDLPAMVQIVTKGSAGVDWIENETTRHVPARKVKPVDTTGAGDCFAGYVVAGLAEGMSPEQALRLGTSAAALQIQRRGTAGAIPIRSDVNALL
ncbi:MAG: ribokinase [Rhodobacteraceae bacterium]|nr:ribokinase [Paracoccaceae bacterium]